jgi:CheY-like chemotaxis protein
MKVLVIEDSSDVRLLLELELTARGYAVVLAESAERGLELAARERPAVVVSDLGLPGVDGIELVRRLRADPRLVSIPAIALSGFSDAVQIDRALAAGYDVALIKPTEAEVLSAAIARCALDGSPQGTVEKERGGIHSRRAEDTSSERPA